MTRDDVLDLFRRSGALLEGHFRLSSGLHSTGYLQCALVLQYPSDAEALGRALAERVRHLRPSVVLSPALGGVVIGHEVGRALGVRAIFAERQDALLTLRRGFTLTAGDRVLVVEDVLTTGGSTRATMQVATAAGVQVVAAAPTFKVTIAYDGSRFVGWQRQAAGTSVQGLLEDVLRDLDNDDVAVAGAGRTDAGVHALGQVASFTLRRVITPGVLKRALNSRLP